MDMNHYMFQDQMMPHPTDPNTEGTRQWSPNSVGTDVQWQHPYQINFADNYNLPYPAHHQLHQPMVPPSMQPGYRPMHTIRSTPSENPRAMASYTRPVIPGSVGHPTYSSVGYSHGQPPALRQLYPSNEQLRSLPEMHPGMQHAMQFGASPAHMGSLSVPMMSRGISAPPARLPRTSKSLDLPKPTSAFSTPFTKLPVKRTETGNSTSPTASPNKKIANLENLPTKARTTNSQTEKSSVPGTSSGKEVPNKPKLQRPNNKGVRFITASVTDVLRWRKDHVFSDIERCNLLIEIVGTVFDIAGLQPVKISVQSQGLINGVFYETDLRLDRNVVLPGCLVKVVLRIPPDEQDFHFLKVSPLTDSVAENAYRRIAYITGSSIQQTKMP